MKNPLDAQRYRFEAEVIPHLSAMRRTALRLARSEADADDLVQDAVLKAYRFFDHFEPGTNVRAWLLKILTNMFFSRYRRRSLDEEVRAAAESDPIADGWISAASMGPRRDPERLMDRPLLESAVSRAVQQLPEDFRAVLVLADVEGLTYREVADACGCPIGTVMSRLHRARRAVAEQLGVAPPASSTAGGARDEDAVVSIEAFKRRKEAVG
jgi:RNA polymerase sigma-70 factor (ECF subfamily)